MAYSSHPAVLNLKNARSRAVNSRQPSAHNPALEQILIVGGGAGGLELATRLGNSLGKRGRAQIELIDRSRTHLWKPLLHEIAAGRSEEHTSELQSQSNLVCRLLLVKKKYRQKLLPQPQMINPRFPSFTH